MPAYDAFISYSHARDKPLASALQTILQRLGKPWYRRRAIRVFRDDTSLSATPHLWPSIEKALDSSRFIILFASPEAAKSRWVGKEALYWIEKRGVDSFLVALTDGNLAWDDAASDFAWTDEAPLPAELRGRFPTEPKWIDLRPFRERPDARDARLREVAADLAAAVRGMPKEDLLSEELRQQKRALTLAWSAAGSLAVLAGAAVWQWNVAREQTERAENTLIATTESANKLVLESVKLRDEVGIPLRVVEDILASVAELQSSLVAYNATSSALERSQGVMLRETAQTLAAANDFEGALAAADKALLLTERLLKGDPTSPELLREQSYGLNRRGENLAKLGRSEEALAAFQTALAVGKARAEQVRDAESLRDLALSYERVGDALGDKDRTAAEQQYRLSLEIRRKLAADDPDNSERQADLAHSYDRVASTLEESDPSKARQFYEDALAIGKSLAARKTTSAAARGDLASTHDRLGKLLKAEGDCESAIEHFNAALALRRGLAESNPDTPHWRLVTAFSHVNLAQCDDNAADNYGEALGILTELEQEGKLETEYRKVSDQLRKRLAIIGD